MEALRLNAFLRQHYMNSTIKKYDDMLQYCENELLSMLQKQTENNDNDNDNNNNNEEGNNNANKTNDTQTADIQKTGKISQNQTNIETNTNNNSNNNDKNDQKNLQNSNDNNNNNDKQETNNEKKLESQNESNQINTDENKNDSNDNDNNNENKTNDKEKENEKGIYNDNTMIASTKTMTMEEKINNMLEMIKKFQIKMKEEDNKTIGNVSEKEKVLRHEDAVIHPSFELIHAKIEKARQYVIDILNGTNVNSCVVTSNLRRAISTCIISLFDRFERNKGKYL